MGLKYKGGQVDRVYSAQLNNIAYANKNGVLTGCEVSKSSPEAMSVDISSGNIFFGNDTKSVSAVTNLAISNNTTLNSRIDLIAVNSTGVISVITGTSGAIPMTPNYDPETYIILAMVTVIANATSITADDIEDIRVLNEGGAGGNGGTFGRYLETFTAQTSVTVTHNLGDDEPNVFVYDNTSELIIPQSITVVDTNSLIVTFSTSTTGKIVVYGGAGVNNAYYIEEYTSSTTWNVAHNLDNKYVNIICYNSSDEVIEPSNITLTDKDNLVVTFGVATAGRVVVTGGSTAISIFNDKTPKLGGDLEGNNKTIDNVETVQFNSELDNGTKTGNSIIVFNNAQKQKIALTANVITLTLDNPTSVGTFQIKVINGGLATLTWASTTGNIYWPDGTTPDLTSSGTDIISFYYDGTDFYGVSSINFS